MPETLITLKKAHIAFRGREVLNDISLAIHSGEILTLIGPNGAGKTTLVRTILGLQEADSGDRHIKQGLRIGYMPQKLHVDQNMPLTVKRFLSLTGGHRPAIQEVVSRTGIGHMMNAPVHTLSGGELQRILLTRALLQQPHLMVLDEPAQGVDINGQRELYQLITEVKNEQGCAVLMVSHDLHLVMASTDRVICLNRHICCSGHPTHVCQHPAYLSMFGKDDQLAFYTHHHNHVHGINGHVIDASSKGSKSDDVNTDNTSNGEAGC